MRARKLAAVAALSVALMMPSIPQAEVAYAQVQPPGDGCAPNEIGADVGPMCRQLSIFGLRFSPKVMRIKVNAPKGTPKTQFPSGTTVEVMWRNGDRFDHQIESVIARDMDG